MLYENENRCSSFGFFHSGFSSKRFLKHAWNKFSHLYKKIFCSLSQPMWDLTIHSPLVLSVLASTHSFLQLIWDNPIHPLWAQYPYWHTTSCPPPFGARLPCWHHPMTNTDTICNSSSPPLIDIVPFKLFLSVSLQGFYYVLTILRSPPWYLTDNKWKSILKEGNNIQKITRRGNQMSSHCWPISSSNYSNKQSNLSPRLCVNKKGSKNNTTKKWHCGVSVWFFVLINLLFGSFPQIWKTKG